MKELYNGAISVSPEQMRFALVRRLFFGGPGSLDFSLLIEKVESINNALYTLIGARARGAIISDLEERLEKLSDVSLWSVYASLGVPETQYIVDKHPDLILDIAEPALIFAPETTIPMLLDIACDDNRPLNSTPDHPMRKLQDWATGAHPSQEDVLARRSTLLSCSKSWWGKTGRTNIAVKAMCIALKPGFEYTSTDPGVGRSVTFTFGRLLDSDLKKIAALWPVVLQVLSEANDIPWGELFQLVHEWLTPDPRIDTPEDTRQYMDQVGSRMLNGLASISKAHAGIQHKIYEFSEENKFQVEVTLDPNFEILYPVERINRDEEEDSQAKAAKDLASDWTSRSVGEITASLKYIEREAYLAGISYPRLTPIVCDYLAKADAQPITTANEFIKEGLPADLLEYFVSKSVNNRITGWEDLVNKCLEEDSYRWVGISVLLTDSEPPQDILKTALGYAVNMGHLIEIPCLRGEVSENTLHVLLTHNDPRIAVPAAIGHWQANRKNRTDLTLSDAWRRAILKSLDDNSMARNDEYWIGEILKKDSELACAWLKKLLAEKRTYLSYGVNETAKRAINALDKTQRRTILESINPEFRSNGLVGLLIDDDMELYADMLGMENLERYHLDPLAGAPDTVWKKKALLALDAGYLPEDIARAVLGNSWTISGPVSVYWQGWIDAFEPLCHDTDARIARIGEFGCEMSRKNQERALKREHEEAIHGI